MITPYRSGQSAVTGSPIGWQTFSGGLVQSYGNNYIHDNGGGEDPPPGIGRK
jgi:hypothetical protein